MLPTLFPAGTLPDLADPERVVLDVVVLVRLDHLVLHVDHDEDGVQSVFETGGVEILTEGCVLAGCETVVACAMLDIDNRDRIGTHSRDVIGGDRKRSCIGGPDVLDRRGDPGRPESTAPDLCAHGPDRQVCPLVHCHHAPNGAAIKDDQPDRVVPRIEDRHRSCEFIAFMNQLLRTYPKAQLHVILDNVITHRETGTASRSTSQ
jgi:hypothetical protein